MNWTEKWAESGDWGCPPSEEQRTLGNMQLRQAARCLSEAEIADFDRELAGEIAKLAAN